MTSDTVSVSLEILDKQYLISCPENERNGLLESARILSNRMKQARDSGRALGAERIAVITALNIIHEALQHKQGQEQYLGTIDREVKGLERKIETAIGRRKRRDKID